MSNDMLRADPRLRRRTIGILVAAAVLCVAAVLVFQRWMLGVADEVQSLDALVPRLQTWTALALTGSALCLAVLAWLAARSGRRACQSEQWPLPGARVIRDTPMRRGAPARRVGRLLQVTALALIALAIGAALVSLRLFDLSR